MGGRLAGDHATGWHAVAAWLRHSGVDTVFGLPDDDLLLLAALADEPVRMVLCRDQRNAVFMAAGYAATSGRPGYCVVGRGPALAYAVGGLVEAAAGRLPVVLLATGTDADRIGTGAFQELDQLSLVRPVVKWAARVEHPRLLGGMLAKAASVAGSGAPGPTYLEIPASVGAAPAPAEEPWPAPAELLAGARRPVVLAGGGMRHHNQDRVVERFAERYGAAILVSASGRGAVDESHPLFCGGAGLYAAPAVKRLWRETDLVIALGSRLEETTVEGWDGIRPPVPVLQVNVEAADLAVGWPGPAVVGDAAAVLAGWADRAGEPDRSWLARVARARQEAVDAARVHAERLRAGPRISVLDVLDALDSTVPADRILVQENGLADMWSYFWPYWTCHSSGGSVAPSEQTSLGFGAAAALGVALAAPERPVVALVGDGAFRIFGADEATAAAATAAVARSGLLYVVLDNGGYGWLQHQLDERGGQSAARFRFAAGDGPSPPGHAWRERVEDKPQLAAALARAWSRCAAGQVAVLEVAVQLDDTPPCLWPEADELREATR